MWMDKPDFETEPQMVAHQMEVDREVMQRREAALMALAAADRVTDEHREILAALAKS